MKLPVSGSAFGNLLLLGVGAVLGASGYWTVDHFDLEPEPAVEDADYAASAEGEQVTDGFAAFSGSRAATPADVDAGVASSEQVNRLRQAGLRGNPLDRAEMLHRAGEEGARRNLEEALVFGHSLERLQDQLAYFRGLFGVWSDLDSEAALAYANRHFSTGLLKSEMIGLVVNKWGAGHPQEARVWAEQNLTGPTRERAMTDLMVGWTRRSPETAAAWLAGADNRSSSMVSAVGRTWAEQDPEAAASWLGGLPPGPARHTATLAVANEWTRQDPASAAEFFKSDLGGGDGLDLATIIADVWGTSDPESAALWVSDLPTGAIRDQAAGALASVWGTRDVEAAARWSDAISDPNMRSQVVAHLGTTWGALEPTRAVEWLSSLPPDLAEVGMVGAMNSWGVVDPTGMRNWVENSAPSAITDSARRSLADVLAQDNLLDSIDIAMGISGQQERNDAVARYFRQWRKVDDASAQEWLGMAWEVMPPDLQDRISVEQRANVIPRP